MGNLHFYRPGASVVLIPNWPHVCCYNMNPDLNRTDQKKKIIFSLSDLPFCCGVGLPLAQHRQGTAPRHHFLFDLPCYQVAGFHSQEVDARLEPHPAETDVKREGETQRGRLIWSSDEQVKNKRKEAKLSQWKLEGTLSEMEFASLRIFLPWFSGWFSLIPDSATLFLCKMSFKIDSRSVVLPPAEYFGKTRQRGDSRSSHRSSHFYQNKCRVTD